MSLTKCGYCHKYHDTVREAMECCSDRLEDDDDRDDGGAAALLADGGLDILEQVEMKRMAVLENRDDIDPRTARAFAMCSVGYENAVKSGADPANVAGGLMAAADLAREDAGVPLDEAMSSLQESQR